MLRKVILFVTSVLVALTAGRAFWVWLGENPANLSGSTYVLFFDEGSRGRIWRIDARTQSVTRFAGGETRGFGGDGGQALRAKLDNPSGLALDPHGNLYVSDYVTNRVRRINARTGRITTVAGNGQPHRADILED